MYIPLPKVKAKSHNQPQRYTQEIRHVLRTIRRTYIQHVIVCQFLETQPQNKLIAKSTYENNLIATSSNTNTSKYTDCITKGSTYTTNSVREKPSLVQCIPPNVVCSAPAKLYTP